MVDMPLADQPFRPGWQGVATAGSLQLVQRVLVAVLLVLGSWVAVSELTTEERCETRLGKLSVQLKLDSYYSGCQCMKRSLDFSDACNSAYLAVLF